MIPKHRRKTMAPGWMHTDGGLDPLFAKLECRLPAHLTLEQKAAVFAEAAADEEAFAGAVAMIADPLLAGVPDIAVYVDKRQQRYRRRLRWAWSAALDQYLAVSYQVDNLGEEFNGTYRAASGLPEPLLDAMTRNLARACLTAGEVYTLLEAGYARGALGRARTLQELDTVSLTLARHPELAEPYLLHHYVERFKFVKAEHDADVAAGGDGIPAAELDELRRTSEDLVARFGPRYRDGWGWAAPILDGQRGFVPLYKKVNAATSNPDYQLSSHLVHASSFGGELSRTMTPWGEHLDTGPDLLGLSEPYELALRCLTSIAVRTIEEATAAALSQYGRITMGALRAVSNEAIDCARETEELVAGLEERLPPHVLETRRGRLMLAAVRESEYARWRARRFARSQSEPLRRTIRDYRAAFSG